MMPPQKSSGERSIGEYNPDIVILQESKLSEVDRKIVKSILEAWWCIINLPFLGSGLTLTPAKPPLLG